MSAEALAPGAPAGTEPTRAASRAAAAVALGAAAELAGIGLLATGAWLLLDASLRPPILLLSSAIALVRFFALLRGGAHFGQRLASHDLGLRIQGRLQLWIFRQLERAWPAGARTGDLLAGVLSDTDEVQDLLVRAAVPLAAVLSALAAAAGAAAFLCPPAGLVVLSGGVAGLVATALSAILAARVRTSVQRARAAVSATVLETLESAEELAALGTAPWALQLLDEAESSLGRATAALARATGAGRFALGAIGSLTVLGTTLVAARAALAGRLDGVALGVLELVALGTAGLLSSLPDALGRVAVGREALARLRALAAPPEAGRGTGSTFPPRSGLRCDPAPPPGRLVLEHARIVRPRSPGEPEAVVLPDLSLALSPSRPVALLGPSGSGKTSVVLAILGFLPLGGGRLLVDGVDAVAMDLGTRRSAMAWAEEEPALFPTTLRANLKVVAPEASDGDLVDVLSALGLGNWLRSLGEGLDTELGPWGKPVSGGERQRIGVARALLSGRPVLLLDEPTAHLGPDDVELVQDAILEASRSRSVLWVTHRAADAERCTEVVRLPS